MNNMKTYRKRYINHIKNYRRHYTHLIALTVLAIISCIFLNIPQCFFPYDYTYSQSADNVYDTGIHFVRCHADTLYYTGYDSTKGSSTIGYYYYSLENDICTFYLISKDTVGNNPALVLNDVHFTGKLVNNTSSLNSLRKYLADDLNWSLHGMQKFSSNIIVSECDYNFIIYVLFSSFTVFIIVADIEFVVFIIIDKRIFSKKKHIKPHNS